MASTPSLDSLDFPQLTVENLKKYLLDRGIQLSEMTKGKRKVELVEMCQKATVMKQPELVEVMESYDQLPQLNSCTQAMEGFQIPTH